MNLSNWLAHIEGLHCKEMDLSLERVRIVAERMNLLSPAPLFITVGGTNGKGSCVAGLEAIYREQGYRVGAFTSPYLLKYNEYVRIDGQDVSDEEFCLSFQKIEAARKALTLTPFEFTALAAFDIFKRAQLDIGLLEVGLGGRFDAVNVIDADLSIVASIGIDHTEWLGDTREKIAFEKAGIFRRGRPAICGDSDPPETLIGHARDIQALLSCQNKDFGFEKKEAGWTWWNQTKRLENLPNGPLALSNLACVLQAVDTLQLRLSVSDEALREGLKKASLTGRIQILPGKINQIIDVSHNPASAALLAQWLKEHPVKGKTRAVFSMLGDKDILGTLLTIKEPIDEWYIAELTTKRAASLQRLQNEFAQAEIETHFVYPSIKDAYQQALRKTEPKEDRIVVFGSFHTVASAIMAIL